MTKHKRLKKTNKHINIKCCILFVCIITIIGIFISYFANNYFIKNKLFKIFILNVSDLQSLLQTIWQIQASISILVIALFTIIQSKFDEKIYAIRYVEYLKEKRFYPFFLKCIKLTYWDFIVLSILLIPSMYLFTAYNLLSGALLVFIVNLFLIIQIISININILINPEKMKKEIRKYIIDSRRSDFIIKSIESVGYEKSYLSLKELDLIDIFNELYKQNFDKGIFNYIQDFYSYYYRMIFENQYLILYDKRRLINLMVSGIFSLYEWHIKSVCLIKNGDTEEFQKAKKVLYPLLLNKFIDILSEILKETIETEDEQTFKNILLETYKLKNGKYYSKYIHKDVDVIYFDSLFISLGIYLYYLIFKENSINEDLKIKFRDYYNIYFTEGKNTLNSFIQNKIKSTIWETYQFIIDRLRGWEIRTGRIHHFNFMGKTVNEFFVFYTIAFIYSDSYSGLINDLLEDVFYDLYPYFKDNIKLISSDSYYNFINLFKPKKPTEQQEIDYKILSKLFKEKYEKIMENSNKENKNNKY